MNKRFQNARDYGSHVTVEMVPPARLKFFRGLKFGLLFSAMVLGIVALLTLAISSGFKVAAGGIYDAANGHAVYIQGHSFTINDELNDQQVRDAVEEMLTVRQGLK